MNELFLKLDVEKLKDKYPNDYQVVKDNDLRLPRHYIINH
jgi:hypothetical protein